MTTGTRFGWTLAITSSAWLLFALDRLVIVTALPLIGTDLGADLAGMQWTVNAYSLAVIVLLLTGAALGDRFGRRRMFMVGMAVFTGGSVGAALVPSVGALVAARAVQGVGGALIAPLALTLLSGATPPARRGAVLGVWGGIGGLGAALGPLVGGGLTGAIGWRSVFWLNVPLGLAVIVLCRTRLAESHGARRPLDIPGVVLAAVGLGCLGWGMVRTGALGWAAPEVLLSIAGALVVLAGFIAWEARAADPMLPIRFFRNRSFAAANSATLLKYVAIFGSLFLIAQLLQTGFGSSPFQAGLRLLPMAVMPALLAPVGGALSDRLGSRPMMTLGVGMVAAGLAWLAAVAGADPRYVLLVPGLLLAGAGSALFFAPVTATVLGSVTLPDQGRASGVLSSVRELGAVIGVAVLGSVLAGAWRAEIPGSFVSGAVPALWSAAAIAGMGMLATRFVPVPTRTRVDEGRRGELEGEVERAVAR